ncbi:MAG: HlyD family efflux transporter periplasmic adaptor subunit [Acidobacteriota bacterium]|jgi:HlyD family secretion protein|nr:HlyD family efflux transporter periplasmic adaptor subunit [Acidobacteriota bacterium]
MRKFLIIAVLVLLIVAAVYFLAGKREAPAFLTVQAARQEIRMTVSTNGIIEPVERSEVYAPIDGRVTGISAHEGAEIAAGQLLMKLESEQIRAALAQANTALLDARRMEKAVLSGPPKDEIAALDAAIDEASLQLKETESDLKIEEALLARGAVMRAAVDALRKQRDQLKVRVDGQKRRKQELLDRYSPEEKQWEADKVRELAGRARFLEQQLLGETVTSPKSGRVYSLEVQPGAYVTRGQLLAKINQPGKIRLRAYIDEPDLGRVAKGQPVEVTWDGLPDRKWTGVVEQPAEQVVSMDIRTVGYVICSIEGNPEELIPNLNVKIEITTQCKPDALVVPRSAVFSPDGIRSVRVFDGKTATTKPVVSGIVTTEDIEILEGVAVGEEIILNPMESMKR